MITHPRTEELAQAVAGWIDQIRPQLDPRNAFLARVAVNVLGVIGRELTQGPATERQAIAEMSALLGYEGDFDALNEALCQALERGEVDCDTPGLLAALRRMTEARIAIDQPAYRAEGS